MLRRHAFALIIALTVVGSGAATVEARGFRRMEVPNLTACVNCHLPGSPPGARNVFGQQIEAHLDGVGELNTQHVVWSEALAALDADGDGLTNGAELGDPLGLWRKGDPMPAFELSNPADASSMPFCGNAVVSSTEACDDGDVFNDDACKADCTLNVCGDGFVRPDLEGCDDGNQVDDDDCSNACATPACGDGVVQAQFGEDCDDGNAANDDGCPATCKAARCGDRFVQAGVEACDDGEATATCNADCTIASCGDGIANLAAGEVCDDGNTSDTDGCLGACVAATCGDGLVRAGVEQCDDGADNIDDVADACSTTCVINRVEDGGCSAGGGGASPFAALALILLALARSGRVGRFRAWPDR